MFCADFTYLYLVCFKVLTYLTRGIIIIVTIHKKEVGKMQNSFNYFSPKDIRINNIVSKDAENSLLHIHETGYLTSESVPPSKRFQMDAFFFLYVVSGKGIVEYDGSVYKADSKQCIFLDCRRPHSYQSDPDDPWEVMWLRFNGISAQYYYSLFTREKCCVFIPNNPQVIKIIISQIINNNNQKSEHTEVLNAKLITDLMTSIITEYCIYKDCSDKSKYKIFSVIEYLDKNFTESINLDDLAERFYISKFYLTREFKKEFGITIIQYIINKRIEYAKELLTFTDKTIEEISEICGFHDQCYFSKQFKKAENVTCLSYRKRNRQVNNQAS